MIRIFKCRSIEFIKYQLLIVLTFCSIWIWYRTVFILRNIIKLSANNRYFTIRNIFCPMALMNTLNSPTWKIKQRHQFSQNKCLYQTLWINSVDAVSLVVCESSHHRRWLYSEAMFLFQLFKHNAFDDFR